jgi:hypothetical protein
MRAPKPAVPFEEDAPRPLVQDLAIDEIKTHPQLQTREQPIKSTASEGAITDYQDDMEEGCEFPPLLVYLVGDDFLLVGGAKRLEAARRAARPTVRCEIRRGSLRDAILASCAENATHGMRRTKPDKERAVSKLLQDPEWSKWSDREIARRCVVSPTFVSKLRGSLTVHVDSDKRTYRTKHGTVAAMNVVHIGRRSEDQATPPTPIRQTPRQPEDAGKVHQPEDAGEVVRITAPPSPAGEPVGVPIDLAAEAAKRRADLVNAVIQIEKLSQFVTQHIFAARSSNLASDSALAGRINAAGEELTKAAELFKRFTTRA